MLTDISLLKPHPINDKIYSNRSCEDLEASISLNGLLEPLVITKENTVISGHRRLMACKNLNMKKVDVRVCDYDDDLVKLVEHNRFRTKSATELLNEIFILEKEFNSKTKLGRPFNNDANTNIIKGSVRDRISKLVGVSNSKIQRLKYIHKNWPEVMSLINEGKATINHVYTETKRREVFNKIQVSKQSVPGILETNSDVFNIYNKSSMNMDDVDDGSVSTIITSPPYWNQRNYGNSDNESVGLEKDIDEYISNVMAVMKDCYRVLSSTGSLFLNLGDKYMKGSLLSLPHRICLEMMKERWVQRNCILWVKSNPKPESIKNRFGNCYEYIFFFTKDRSDYYFDMNSIREEYVGGNNGKILSDVRAPRHHSTNGEFVVNTPVFPNPFGKVPLDMITTPKCSFDVGKDLDVDYSHGAVYPIELCKKPILSTSKPNDYVLDPFCGSGSTGEMAIKLGRKFIGYELNHKFAELSCMRLNKVVDELDKPQSNPHLN